MAPPILEEDDGAGADVALEPAADDDAEDDAATPDEAPDSFAAAYSAAIFSAVNRPFSLYTVYRYYPLYRGFLYTLSVPR